MYSSTHQDTISLSDYVGISIESVPSGISILDSNTSEDAKYVAAQELANRLENRTKDTAPCEKIIPILSFILDIK